MIALEVSNFPRQVKMHSFECWTIHCPYTQTRQVTYNTFPLNTKIPNSNAPVVPAAIIFIWSFVLFCFFIFIFLKNKYCVSLVDESISEMSRKHISVFRGKETSGQKIGGKSNTFNYMFSLVGRKETMMESI